MPTYEYACTACEHRYEKREGFDAPAKQKCPKCRKTSNRLLSAPAVVFKGTGFYKTDSRGSDSGNAPSSSGSGADSAAAPAAATPAADAGHGHSHGADGHSHDAPAPATPAPATESKPKSKPKESTGSAAGG